MATTTHLAHNATRVETTPDAAGRALDIRFAAAMRSIQRGRVSLILLTETSEAAITPDDAVEIAKQLLKYAQRARRQAQH
jgi:hypothetical protein